ncbi:MAG: hypothetical protein J1F12_08425 [Muribaculaceae bacterium]|nr:hypothetical protein [Muribaculaceae bacterium]
MSSVDLNIIERGLKGQEWTAEKGPITAGDLANIAEQRTNNSSALNALPTPFARFFVFKEAFRRALEELKDKKKIAGDAYNRLVSDALDIFELLYNQTYHASRWEDSRKINIYEWDYTQQLPELKRQVPILASAIENYFKSDLKAASNKLFFVVLTENGRDYLLATSSPFTGFITPPDLDKKVDTRGKNPTQFIGKRYEKFPSIHRKSGGTYFKDIKLFGDRDKSFKNYMYYLVNNDELGQEMRELRDYIKQFAIFDQDIIKGWEPSVQPIISTDSNEVNINGLTVYKDNSISTVNFFNDTLIKLPFRLSKEYYHSMKYANDNEDRDYDFIIPISKEGLEKVEGDFECSCKVTATKVIVSLSYKGHKAEKEYTNDGLGSNGRIVNLKDREKINFNLAIFPNILSPTDKENNYFKIMAVVNDSTTDYRPFSIDKLDLSFYYREEEKFKEIEVIDTDNYFSKFGIHPAVIRSKQNEGQEIDASSKFYEVFNTKFDAINVRFGLDSGETEGFLFPKWKVAQRTNESYTYAIDLGTTNTYISCTKDSDDNEPEQLSMDEPMVAFLHDVKKSKQHPTVSLIESAIDPKSRKNFNTEFIPAMIDGHIFKFPIRTALVIPRNDKSATNLFDNSNIAFFYEKTTGLGNQTILTDLKWQSSHERELRIFIRELLLIVKTDILQKNGLLSATKIIWFKPLSFKTGARDLYNKIWTEEAKEVLNIPSSQIENISESEAPYYYFRKKNAFQSIDAVSIVDIGGGSTDFIYFADSKPQIANSVHFGCDVLWGNGFNEYDNARDNGIYQKYVEAIHFDDEELEKLNLQMRMSPETSTKDILNFWLSNDDKSEISKKLRDAYKPLFLYHFASIVYFMAKMYHAKGLECPRSVLFCGNGSRYIDGFISSNTETVEQIVTAIFKNVYGSDIKKVQVILPEVRKESTCYGGLYRKKGVDIPTEFNFQGIDSTEYENVETLKKAFPSIRKDLLVNFNNFNKLYKELLNILVRNGELENFTATDKIINLISSDLEDSLTKNFKTQVVETLNDNEVYHDSVFFLPVIDNVLKLTKI